MFFISRGTVRVFVVPEDDECLDVSVAERYIISLGDGSFFGEVALLDEVRYNQSLVTTSIRHQYTQHLCDAGHHFWPGKKEIQGGHHFGRCHELRIGRRCHFGARGACQTIKKRSGGSRTN